MDFKDLAIDSLNIVTHHVPRKPSNTVLALSLAFAVILWGGNNTGTKVIVNAWPPIWTGSSRFLCAGLILLGVLRWTPWLGTTHELAPEMRKSLWLRGGLSLATYIVCFNWALRFTSVSHIALYLGAAPVWALLWEGRPERSWTTLKRYGAAGLALIGVLVLFWPAFKQTSGNWLGEFLGLAASVLWTNYGRQCRALSGTLSGAQVSAHTMWRAGVILVRLALVEIRRGLSWRADVVLVQVYCILAGGVVAF